MTTIEEIEEIKEIKERQSCWSHQGTYLLFGTILLIALAGGIAYYCGLSSQIPPELQWPYWIAVLGAGALAIVMMLAVTIQTKCTCWVLSKDRLTRTVGVLHSRKDDLELYRVRDIAIDYPFPWGLFHKIGSVIVYSTDVTDRRMTIGLIKEPEKLYNELLKRAEARKSAVKGKEEFVEI